MKKAKMIKRIIVVILTVFAILNVTDSQAQIGKLKDLKNKAVNSQNNNNNNNSTTTTTTTENKSGKSGYDQDMADGEKYKNEKKYLEALVSYKKALAEKSGDYSAKNQVQLMTTEVENQYLDIINNNISDGKCDEAKANLDKAMAALEFWSQQKYLNGQIAECNENAASTSASSSNKADVSSIAAGKGAFFTDFSNQQLTNNVYVGDDLFVVFKLAKTMMESSQELGLSSTFNAYGFFTIYMDGKKVDQAGPFQFTSNYSKVWQDLTLPLSVSDKFAASLQANPALLANEQDIWLLQQLFVENGITRKYIMAAIQNMQSVGKHSLKIEFGLANESDKAPKGVIAVGETTVNVDKDGLTSLYKKGPKYLRPIEENEKGAFVSSNSSYELGNSDLVLSLKLPQAPKYYNMKWCQPNTCDYDHGNLIFYVELDGKYFTNWQTTFWNEDYEVNKDFSAIIFPATDKDFANDFSDFNEAVFFKKGQDANPIVYALYDLLYSNHLSVGKHSLKFKLISPEVIPMNTTFEATADYFNKWQAIAENTIDFNVGASTKSKLEALSSAKKLTHAGGAWASVDAYLKANNNSSALTVIDVATTTEWKVTLNVLSVPLYRQCRADVIYTSANGATRLQKDVLVNENYQGNNQYANPTLMDLHVAGLTTMSYIHYPVPISKVK